MRRRTVSLVYIHTSNDDSVLALEVEVLLIAEHTVGVDLETLESDATLHLARQLGEELLARLVGRARRSDLVYPLVLRVVVDDELFHEAAEILQCVALRHFRAFCVLIINYNTRF